MWGGRRKGAGRKRLKVIKLPYSTRLRMDQILWLRSRPNACITIEQALDKIMKLTKTE